jgi:hypothetical protein
MIPELIGACGIALLLVLLAAACPSASGWRWSGWAAWPC